MSSDQRRHESAGSDRNAANRRAADETSIDRELEEGLSGDTVTGTDLDPEDGLGRPGDPERGEVTGHPER